MQKSKVFFKEERQQTDDSLVAERDKTNQSLTKLRTETEVQTDKAVTKDRFEADSAAKALRAEADLKNNHQPGNGVERVMRERKRSDKAMQDERSHVDLAMDTERKLKRELSGKVLETERKRTDKNLSHERKQTDTEVQRSSTLLTTEVEEHSKTKFSLTTRDEFLAIVSHDLRNPIGAVSTCADMLLEDSNYQGIDTEVKYWIEFMKRNADTSLRMIADLLDMERMAEGQLQLKIEKHNLSKIIRQAVESYVHQAAAKNILLRSAQIKESLEINCDSDRILQVLSNIIGNALKFTKEGGSITLKVEVIQKTVKVSVSDTGSGIAEEMVTKIFDRFAQIGTNDRRGLGLGLYISKMLIEAHGGEIGVNSKVNFGTTFYFTLPL
jgi:signal transduction histidine kinase